MANLASDPVIEFYKLNVDRAALRENLKLSVDERLQRLQELADKQPPRRQAPSPTQPWEPVSDCGPDRTSDPVIELYKRDVDRTLLIEGLRRTLEQRFDALASMAEFVEELRSAGRRSRRSS